MNHISDYSAVLHKYFQKGQLLHISKNKHVTAIENRKRTVYFIRDGYMRIYSKNRRNDQYTHIIYGPGEIFPLTWIFGKTRTNVHYEAMTDASILCLPTATLNKDLLTEPQLSYSLLQQTIEQYRIYTMRVDNLEYKYASERLAYCLILLANRFGERNGKSVTIIPVHTHQLLGSSLNLSRESISREMEKLLRNGLVRYNAARQIVIDDIEQLAAQLKVPLHHGLSVQTAPDVMGQL